MQTVSLNSLVFWKIWATVPSFVTQAAWKSHCSKDLFSDRKPTARGCTGAQQTMKNHPVLYPLTTGTQDSGSPSASWLQPTEKALSFACNHMEVICFLIGNGDAEGAEPCHTWGSHHYRGQKQLPAWLSCHLLGCCVSRKDGACPIPPCLQWAQGCLNPCLPGENNGKGLWRREGCSPLNPWLLSSMRWISMSQIYSVSWVEELTHR